MSDKMPLDTRPEATPPEDVTPGNAVPPTGAKGPAQLPGEIGGPQGPEPTRYGDWEFKGRCSDF